MCVCVCSWALLEGELGVLGFEQREFVAERDHVGLEGSGDGESTLRGSRCPSVVPVLTCGPDAAARER